MSKLPERAAEMVSRLEQFATTIHAPPQRHSRLEISNARAAMAQLRRGVGKQPAECIEALRHVVAFFPDLEGSPERTAWEREALFIIATLFAVHPTERGAANTVSNPGALYRALGGNEAEERRFVALLNCTPDRLANHLRQAVQLARSREVAVNYRRWLEDVLAWNDPELRERVRLRWARDYWQRESSETKPKADSTPVA